MSGVDMISELLMSFLLNKINTQTYKQREGKKTTLSIKPKKEKAKMATFNEALQGFHTELKTTSAPDLSVCYMMFKGSSKVRLIAYRYGRNNTDLEGNGQIFGTIDQARAYAYKKGYIVPEPEE